MNQSPKLIALILISVASKITATTINCSFDNIIILIGRFNTIQGYGCDIQSLTSEDPQTPVKFSGFHDYDKTDDDVTIIKYQIYDEYQLPQFDSSFCEQFPNIETIFISQLEILSVNENSLRNCQKLSKLYFYGNKIRELPENLLAENSKLIVFNVDSNFLTELPETFLQQQRDLEELGLTSNQINFLPSYIFRSLKKLKFLRLGRNKISSLDPKWFRNLGSMINLGIEENMITEVPNKCFKSLSNLIDLNLSNNRINSLSSNTFSGLKNLKTLNLDHNKIENLPKNIFKDSRSLEDLTIAYNKISVIHSDSFGFLTNFTKFHCYSNEIEAIDEKLIENTAIENFDVSSNICIDDSIFNRDHMKNSLSDCFENYQPRTEDYDSGSKEVEDDTTLIIEEESTTTTSLAPSTTTTSTTLSSTTQTITTLEQLITAISTTLTEPPSTEPTSNKLEINTGLSAAVIPELIEVCGKPKVGLPTIIKGTTVVRGSFPWNAALLKTNGNFFCGGTLVSKNKVVTAAHCLQGKYQSHVFNAADVLVALGVHNLSKTFEVGRNTAAVKNIINHPSWNPNIQSFDADIAVLELEDEVTFTKFIQPICLIPSGSEVESILTGIVVGFGRSEEKNVENIARVINMPMYSFEDCSKSKDHEKLLSRRTFCGGHANGTGVCVGDSGSGLYVSHNNIYYLRGIVSASLHGDLYGCNVDAYAVFTDVIKFKNWIETGSVHEKPSEKELLMLLQQFGIKSYEELKNLGIF